MRPADLALVLFPPGAAVPVGEEAGFFGNSRGSDGMWRMMFLCLP